jgi:hypothetical protein
MKAICKIPFRGVPDGEHQVRSFNVGDELEGELAEVAVINGWAARDGAPGPKEHQALGGAPEPFRETQGTTLRRRRERA